MTVITFFVVGAVAGAAGYAGMDVLLKLARKVTK